MYPIIKNISDVLSSIEGRKEFLVMDKGDYIVIDYAFVEGDSFDDPMRRECRGITFDKETGVLIRRPMEKFDNYGEKFSQDKCDFEKDHIVTDKRDGSMIAAFTNKGQVRFGTRAGITEHSVKAEKHLDETLKNACSRLIMWNFTPIFEWTSPDNRIVLDYKDDEIRLLRIRHNETGIYEHWDAVEAWANVMGIKTVDRFNGVKVSDEWIAQQKAEGLGIEGFVVFFPETSFSVKIKTDEYTQMHRAVSYFERENMVLPIILDNQYDDLLPALSEDRQQRVRDYASAVWNEVKDHEEDINKSLEIMKAVVAPIRKDQALWIQANVRRELWPVMFRALDGDKVIDKLKEAVLKNPEALLNTRWN